MHDSISYLHDRMLKVHDRRLILHDNLHRYHKQRVSQKNFWDTLFVLIEEI